MPDAGAWESFAGVAGVVIFLGAAVVGLRRLGLLGGRPATSAQANPPTPAQAADKEALARVEAVEKALADLRLCIAENYVRRDDYITNESRVIGLLENHSVMLARLEERIGART